MEFTYPAAIPWVIFALVVLAIIACSTVFVWCFKDSKEWALVPSLVTISGLSIILLCSFLIPVDIFTVSQTENPTVYALAVRVLYYISYLTLLVFAFALIPFAYFFYEEDDTDVRRMTMLLII
jgi:LMBR1 domain-containing protein 1